jgi:hypothetical protein
MLKTFSGVYRGYRKQFLLLDIKLGEAYIYASYAICTKAKDLV